MTDARPRHDDLREYYGLPDWSQPPDHPVQHYFYLVNTELTAFAICGVVCHVSELETHSEVAKCAFCLLKQALARREITSDDLL